MRNLVLGSFGLALVAAACTTAEKPRITVPITDKVLLRYHPDSGATFAYVLDQTSRIGPDTFATDTAHQNALHMALRRTITAATAESVTIRATLDSGWVAGPALSPSEAERAARSLRGVSVSAVFDNQQRLLHEDWSGIRRLPGVVGDQLQLLFRAAALALPDQPVGTGDDWTNTIVLPFGQVTGGAPLVAKTRVRVTELVEQAGDTLARLAVVTDVPDKPLHFSFGGQSITVALSGTVAGEQRFSLTRGALIEANLGGTLLVRVTGGMFGPTGMTMRVDQQGAMRLIPPGATH